MSVEVTLMQRADSKCELCGADKILSVYPVPASAADDAEHSVLACDTCQAQLTSPDLVDANHWRCLNDSMWSQTAAVQVVAWRQLKVLTEKGETWAQDLLDMLYLEPDTQAWAEAGYEEPEDDDTEPTLDCNGARLSEGDTVHLMKDLVVKGANFTAKRGTPVRNISLTSNPLHIEGRVNGTRIVIISDYVKRSTLAERQ
ncbi:PhnA domain-containing protein [Paraferrimonas haliotis]|uniref:PhnA protein n=1 Tax=Paraferrimonas haliotis TaxID=2013866 RepID=A0AA37WVV0_9GAMM|nr:alkylphosphonate utilization protein [Paraferrimonas haliotis]GLS82532.1 PhnA protein [Paraferrimonas haliotis]